MSATRAIARRGWLQPGALAALLLTSGGVHADDVAAVGPPPAVPPGGILAGIPLETLRATRERPLFVPSRRPPEAPPPPVAVEPSAPPPAPVEAQDPPPRFTLLGIIRSPKQGEAAVVLDDADHTSFNLKPGDGRRGWQVQSIAGTVVTLRNGERTLALTYREPPAQSGSVPGAAGPAPQDDQ